jgi:chorismate mutase
MKIDLEEVRIKLDQHAERIVSGLKDRSRSPLNKGTFEETFFQDQTWFEYRLLKEQSLDAEFGRYEFEDQHPLLISRLQLEKPKVRRDHPALGLVTTKIDNSRRIISMYRKVLGLICQQGEDRNSYGETTKLDVGNVLELDERIFLGKAVAEAKLQSNPSLKYLEAEAIRTALINKTREQEVIEKARLLARRYSLAQEEVVADLFKEIIEVTLDLEVDYILQAKEAERSTPKARIYLEPPQGVLNIRGWDPK